MRVLTTITFIALCFTQAIAQEFPVPVPINDELMYSRMQSRLKGLIRTVLTVEKSDEGGYARTLSTATRGFDIEGAAIEDLYHYADIELHTGKLVRLDYSTIFSYDSKHRLSRISEYDPDGSLRYRRVFSYDEKGRPSEQTHYEGETKPIGKQGYLYDIEKRTTTVTYGTSKTVFFYNDKGWWTKRIVYKSDGSIEDNTTFEHDDIGNVIKETKYDQSGNYLYSHLFKYSFDKFGNWVEKQTTYTELGKDGKVVSRPDVVVYRVITYFSR
jgi:hypothetical protein